MHSFCSFAIIWLLLLWFFFLAACNHMVRREKKAWAKTLNNNNNNNFTNYLNNYAVHLIHRICSCCERASERLFAHAFGFFFVPFFYSSFFHHTTLCLYMCVCATVNSTILCCCRLNEFFVCMCVFKIFPQRYTDIFQLFCLLLLVIICPNNCDLLMSANVQITPWC